MFRRLKGKILVVGILLALIVSNPTIADFNSFVRAKNYDLRRSGRKGYFLFFSLFNTSDGYRNNLTYVGFFENFMLVSGTPNPAGATTEEGEGVDTAK